MSVEKIIGQIKKDSEKEIDQIIKEAKKQAEIIKNSAKKEALAQSEKIIVNGKQQIEKEKKILLSKANQEFKRDIMNTKEKIIDECFTKAHHELSILKGEKYKKLVEKLVKSGIQKLGDDCTVFVTRDIDKEISVNLGLKIEGKIDSSGGVILKSADGKVTLNNTFDGILKREKDKIRIEVGKLLFS